MRVALLLLSLLTAVPAVAADIWLPIVGTVNNFRTDARVLNPGDTDIEVSAYFLPTDVTNNNERLATAPVKFTVARRSMRAFDDVVSSLFNSTGLGAVLFTSPAAFNASSRIYAIVDSGTLGQFSAGASPGLATPRGLIFQLKSSTTFRTNLGVANIANAPTAVTWTLYDRNNVAVTTATTNLTAYEVLRPTNIRQVFSDAGSADLSDCWVSFTATNPVFAYGSVVDNGTTDPTFIPATPDR
jgi:hypothetical protein